jgi:hypothetical protein
MRECSMSCSTPALQWSPSPGDLRALIAGVACLGVELFRSRQRSAADAPAPTGTSADRAAHAARLDEIGEVGAEGVAIQHRVHRRAAGGYPSAPSAVGVSGPPGAVLLVSLCKAEGVPPDFRRLRARLKSVPEMTVSDDRRHRVWSSGSRHQWKWRCGA